MGYVARSDWPGLCLFCCFHPCYAKRVFFLFMFFLFCFPKSKFLCLLPPSQRSAHGQWAVTAHQGPVAFVAFHHTSIFSASSDGVVGDMGQYIIFWIIFTCVNYHFPRSDMIPHIQSYDNWPISLNDTLIHSGWTLVLSRKLSHKSQQKGSVTQSFNFLYSNLTKILHSMISTPLSLLLPNNFFDNSK